jgi:hypothetical protein
MKPGIDGKLYCSFCGKSQDEVQKLIAGPTVFICDECIDLCKQIVEEERGPKAATPEPPADPAHLPDYVARLKLAIEDEQRGRAEQLRELRNLEFEANAYIEALLEIAFPEHASSYNNWQMPPGDFMAARAYTALGGRIENGVWLDSYEDLKDE